MAKSGGDAKGNMDRKIVEGTRPPSQPKIKNRKSTLYLSCTCCCLFGVVANCGRERDIRKEKGKFENRN